MATQQQIDFAREIYQAAKKATDIAPEFVTAQAILESGWGKNRVGQFNLFGITRRLQEMARTVYRTQTVVRTMVRDSVVKIAPGRTDTLPCLSYRDPWLSFAGCLRADSFIGEIHARDTLDIVVHRIPRRFLFFRWGCKAVKMQAVCRNPHTQLTYMRYVRLVD